MASLQDQYLEAMRQSQEGVLKAFESWTKSVQQTFGQTSTSAIGPVDANQIIDEVFQFAEKMLETQRQFAKSLIAASESAVEGQRR
jgi:acetyl-CoA carboxylase carboxyltransferase component